MGCGVYFMLSGHIIRIIFGVSLLSAATNLLIFVAGRLQSTLPPIIRSGSETLDPLAANPLPQALILTAIVIGFALVCFVAALAFKAYKDMDTLNTREMLAAEAEGSPYSKEEKPHD